MKNKKVIYLVILLVFAVVLITTSFSYAFLTITKTSEKTSTLIVGKLSLKLNESKNSISLTNAYPISDTSGKNQNPFPFTLENNGTMDGIYAIYLKDQTIDNESNRIDDRYIKYYFEKTINGVKTDELNFLSSLTKNENGRLLDQGIIKVDETNEYSLRLWLDYDTTLEQASGKELSTKLYITETQIVE